MKPIERLIAIGGPSIGSDAPTEQSVPERLRPLVGRKNGFFAFESALFIRPWRGAGTESAEVWNSRDWVNAYEALPRDVIFFAEDVFGFQFAVDASGFYSFDPETGELDFMCVSMEEWATTVLDDFEVLTGYPAAHEWQLANGPIRNGYRLAPAIPFVLGGQFDAGSLRAKPDLELADFRASIFAQIKDLPDGAQIRLEIQDP